MLRKIVFTTIILSFAIISNGQITRLANQYYASGEYEKAVENAKLAMQLGYPLQVLKSKLVKAGEWK